MKLPREAPVMTLPNATLFPQALLPLCIFEPRYRQMLAGALRQKRMFVVAMQKPRSARETPVQIAGLGLIRASVRHSDHTSHLILQGLSRVKLGETVRTSKTHRVHRISPVETPPCDSVAADALMAKVRELLAERLKMGMPPVFPSAPVSPMEVLEHLDAIENPDQAADLVSCAVLPGAAERQAILETFDVETRLRRLIQFLVVEIRKKRKDNA